ncbi:6009_t:CDS:2 [Funneliformis caledonium]|uniref:6009_t:CDS:1 n=1 Tax=Funneliformis caledonium TaxID=1117310 RepID=A0A9N9EU25_9GLOM|nr:6009_t:CDS:2 [Funneliformis caledonium]
MATSLFSFSTFSPLSSVHIKWSFDVLRQEGCYYLDKTHFIPKIEALRVPAILSLRSCHFGKTLFLSTLSSYYDVKNRKRFKQLFQGLYIGKNPTPLASEFLVLELNFAGLRTNETDHFQVVDENRNAFVNFRKLLNAVILSNNKLYVCIDEYDGSMNEALKNQTPLQALTNHHKNEGDFKIELMESSFKQLFSILKTACDGGIARVFLTGVTPVAMAEFISGFNISVDLTLNEEF